MKSYLSVSWKYLKEKKKRTILTIIGVILSMALITGTGTIIASMHNLMVQEEIERNGDWHIKATEISGDKVNLIANHVDIKKTAIVREIGCGKVSEMENGFKETYDDVPKFKIVNIKGYDTNAMEMLPLNLVDGRVPENEDELVVEEWILNEFNVSIGDSVSIDIGDITISETFDTNKTETFVIVGTLEKSSSAQDYVGIGISFFDNTEIVDNQTYSIYSQTKNIRKTNNVATSISQSLGVEGSINVHSRLLMYYAVSSRLDFDASLIAMFLIIVTLIIMATVAVIFNAFNISVVERMRQFGLLRCIGATPKQIKRIILREALLIGGIGISIGTICGLFAMKIVFAICANIDSSMSFLKNMEIVISLPMLAFCVALGVGTVVFSAYRPARRAGKIPAVDAVRSAGEFLKEKKGKIRKGKLVGFIFGFEGNIASKNLKRNKKRFRITIFSMSISIVLLIFFGYYFNSASDVEMGHQSYGGDFSYILRSGEHFEKEDINEIKEIEGVDNVFLNYSTYIASIDVPKNKIDEKFLEIRPDIQDEVNSDWHDSVYLWNGELICIGDENLKKLNEDIDIEKMNAENSVVVVQNFLFFSKEKNQFIKMNNTNFEKGDTIKISIPNFGIEDLRLEYKTYSIASDPYLREKKSYADGIYVYVTEKQFEEIETDMKQYMLFISVQEGANLDEIASNLQNVADENADYRFYDHAKEAQDAKNAMAVISLFIFGFIAIIALIGCVNIINTISTNIILQTRELSILRAIGSDQKSIKKMVMVESALYGIYAIVWGGTIGVLLSYVFYLFLVGIMEFPWRFPYEYLLIAGVGCFIVTFLSGQIPLKRINKSVIVENLRMD